MSSFVSIALNSDFPINNIPFGIISSENDVRKSYGANARRAIDQPLPSESLPWI